MRETVAPIVPEAGFAERELAVGFDALVALAMNDFLPDVVRIGELVLRGFVVRSVLGDDYFQEFVQYVAVVDIGIDHVPPALRAAGPS